MSAFVVLWLVVAAYQVVEVVRAILALLSKGGTVTFHWTFLALALLNSMLGGLYMVGVIR